MSPRAKSAAAKSKPAKATHAKSVQTPATHAVQGVEGLRTPGDRAGAFDLRNANYPWPKRRDIGKGLRERTPRESHADAVPVANRPDTLDLLGASNVGR